MELNQRQLDALKLLSETRVPYHVTENYPLSRSTMMALLRRGLVDNYRNQHWKINRKGREVITH